jgi:hypothetical protein
MDARRLYPKLLFKMVLGGEMQYSLSYYPASYLTTVSLLKAAAPGVRLGAHFTNYLLCEDCNRLMANKTEAKAYQTLFNKTLDFIGVSAYPSVDPVFKPGERRAKRGPFSPGLPVGQGCLHAECCLPLLCRGPGHPHRPDRLQTEAAQGGRLQECPPALPLRRGSSISSALS